MTAKQDALYWREWGALVRVCKRDGTPAPDRHALHVAALGADKGHGSFTNAEFDRVLAEFRVWSRPGDLRAQLRQSEQPLTRLRWRVRELSEGREALLAKLLQDRFTWPVWLRKNYLEEAGTRLEDAPRAIVSAYRDSGLRVAVEDLNEAELTHLRDTLARIKPARTAKAKPATDPAKLADAALADCPY